MLFACVFDCSVCVMYINMSCLLACIVCVVCVCAYCSVCFIRWGFSALYLDICSMRVYVCVAFGLLYVAFFPGRFVLIVFCCCFCCCLYVSLLRFVLFQYVFV